MVLSILVFTLLFAMIYKVLPDAEVAWRDVWIGALMTAVLFAVGKFLIGLYLGRSSVASAYGAAGSLIVLLLWIYYSAQILLFGAEFTKVDVATEGTVRAFSIVSLAAPGIPVPFVAAVIDCAGTSVRANLVNVETDAEHISLGMKVRLATFPLAADTEGTEAVGFGFEPLEATRV